MSVGPRARKRFGQHFLESAWVTKLLAIIDPRPDDTFLEIGPGRGAITRPLCEAAGRVVAVEIDRDLASRLQATAPSNLTIVQGDFLDATADDLRLAGGVPVRVAGNLPYNVAAPMLLKLVDWYGAGVGLSDATLMLQREVADRLIARPGTGEYGVLTVMVRQWADAARVLTLPQGAFRPPPKVQSAVVQLRFRPPAARPRDDAVFAAVVQAIFTRRRKMLANALLAYGEPGRARRSAWAAEVLQRADLDGRRRPETLDIRALVRLADAVAMLPDGGSAVLP
jgi:16S rRNA (adenine1518-N6/adenine1519-N6)-dimethyltransferase